MKMTPLQSLLDAYHSLKPNSRKHAEFYLSTGQLHPECHFVIATRLAAFIRRVEAGGLRLRTDVLRALDLPLPAEEVDEFPAELEGAAG
jgi:hypothetical protein